MCPFFSLTSYMVFELYIIWSGVPLRKCLFFFPLFTFYNHWAFCTLVSHCRTRHFREVIDDSSHCCWQILIPTRTFTSIWCLKYSVVPWWFSIPNLMFQNLYLEWKNLSFWKGCNNFHYFSVSESSKVTLQWKPSCIIFFIIKKRIACHSLPCR